jgi:hypothetical protein
VFIFSKPTTSACRAGGAGVFQTYRRGEAQRRNVIGEQRGRKVLIQKAGIEMADVDRIDLLGVQPGMFERAHGRIDHHLLGVELVEFAEGGVEPTADDWRTHEVCPRLKAC